MGSDVVDVTEDGHVSTVTLNRPDKKNALSLKLARDLLDAVKYLETTDTRVVVLCGEGGVFCAGGDLEQSPDEFVKEVGASIELLSRMLKSDLPYIAAIEGAAIGGGLELALACDLRVVSSDAKLGLPEVSVGIFPCAGGTRLLPRIVGETRAKDLLLSGRLISGEEALGWGLANREVATGNVYDASIDLANELAGNSPIGITAALQSANQAFDTGVKQGMKWDLELANTVAHQPDFEEGKRAFLEKRQPNFTDE